MKTHQIDTMEREEIKLVGFSITESLSNVLESKIVGTLREDLEKRMYEIENRDGSGIYLIQIYPHNDEWTPHVPFQHVVGFEVTSYGEIPNGMITHTVAPGRFIKIIHKGAESQIHTLESEVGQIDIYIPAK